MYKLIELVIDVIAQKRYVNYRYQEYFIYLFLRLSSFLLNIFFSSIKNINNNNKINLFENSQCSFNICST